MAQQNSRNDPHLSDEQKINELITALGALSIDRRHEAIRALKECGEPAVPFLIRALADSADNDPRWYAAVALSKIGEPAIEPLIAAMRLHREKEFRRYGAAALGDMGSPAVEPLISAMVCDDADLGLEA